MGKYKTKAIHLDLGNHVYFDIFRHIQAYAARHISAYSEPFVTLKYSDP